MEIRASMAVPEKESAVTRLGLCHNPFHGQRHGVVLKQAESSRVSRLQIAGVVIDPVERTVLSDDLEVPLEPRAFDVLLYLARHPGRVVSRQELLDAVWHRRVVTDDAVYRAVRLARSVFGKAGPRVIKTVHARGYRLAESVQELPNEPAKTRKFQQFVRPSAWFWLAAAGIISTVLAIVSVIGLKFDAGPSALHSGAAAESPVPLAVLPFEAAGGGEAMAYLGRELAAELSEALRTHRGLLVLGEATSRAVAAGEELTTAYGAGDMDGARIVSGRVRPSRRAVRVQLEVRDLQTRRLVGSEAFQWSRSDLSQLKTALAGAVLRQLSIESQVPPGSERALLTPAYERFLEARHAWRGRAPDSLDRAAALLHEALELAPDFARAYEALAAVYLVMPSWQEVDGEAARFRAYSAAREALRLDPGLGEARAILAEEARAAGQWSAAEGLFERALEDDPHNPSVLQWFAEFQLMRGQLEQAAEKARQAVALDPMSAIANTVQAWAAVIAGRNDEALLHARRAVALGLPSSNIIVAWAERRRGDREAAASALESLLRPSAAIPICRSALLGNASVVEARQAILDSRRSDQLAVIYHLVCLAMLNAGDIALELIDRQSPGIEFAILWAPEFEQLRLTPEFGALATPVEGPPTTATSWPLRIRWKLASR